MRNPDRIEPFMEELGQLWKEHFPDWRFGQMMYNFITSTGDPFHYEEDMFLEAFKAYCKGEDAHNAVMKLLEKKIEERDATFQGESNIRRVRSRPIRDYLSEDEKR